MEHTISEQALNNAVSKGLPKLIGLKNSNRMSKKVRDLINKEFAEAASIRGLQRHPERKTANKYELFASAVVIFTQERYFSWLQ